MQELWQLFNAQGNPIKNKGGDKDEVWGKGLLHGASHVWIYRIIDKQTEILVQKRSPTKRTWPNRYDISAAGHIDLGETPLISAIREVDEEIGLKVKPEYLELFSVQRMYMNASEKDIENEFQWLYAYRMSTDSDFLLQESEVESLQWIGLNEFELECTTDSYVPHSNIYYKTVIQNIKRISSS